MLAHATTTSGITNLDLDTGDAIHPGTYRLCDETYADLLHQIALKPATPIPFGMKRDLLAYFADPAKASYLQREPKQFALMQAELPILAGISTHAAYPDTAFLPEPVEDAAPAPAPPPAPASAPDAASAPAPASAPDAMPAAVPVPAPQPQAQP
jgi:hypothetical protein